MIALSVICHKLTCNKKVITLKNKAIIPIKFNILGKYAGVFRRNSINCPKREPPIKQLKIKLAGVYQLSQLGTVSIIYNIDIDPSSAKPKNMVKIKNKRLNPDE
ncbi:hypothetical protein AwWohl_04750 [Gammaproteobacteria bacterium]|nr:hypothetical protein AwWohl_04750 [Gammaproteobacteria bacterium]